MQPNARRWLAVTMAAGLAAIAAGCPQSPPPATSQVQAKPSGETLSGRVVDDKGQPVSGAIVQVSGTDLSATTDADGRYTLTGVPVGNTVLTISGPGLKTVTRTAGTGQVSVPKAIDPTVGLTILSVKAFVGGDAVPVGQPATIAGTGFGEQFGQVTVNGQTVPIATWADDRIVVLIDGAGLVPGQTTLTVTHKNGKYLSRKILLDKATGKAPDLTALFGSKPPVAGESDASWSQKVLGSGSPYAGSYRSDFSTIALGKVPPEWVDVIPDLTGRPGWLYPGKWGVFTLSSGPLVGHVLNQSETAPQPYFSIRRYGGSVFGVPDGALPATYYVEAKLQVGESPHFKAPVGESSLLAFYLDPANYIQLSMEANHIALYEANNAKPMESTGWKGYMWFPYKSGVGDVHVVGAEVDTVNGTIRPVIDGKSYSRISLDRLRQPARHYVAFRAAGNQMNIGDIRIEAPLATPAPVPTPQATPTPLATPVPTPSATPTPAATPTPTPTPKPSPTPTPKPTPTPSASPSASPSPGPSV